MSGDVPDRQPSDLPYTVDDLRAAVRLVDPTADLPNEFYERAVAASSDDPHLMPSRVIVALTVVSEKFRRATDSWLAGVPPRSRARFERERDLLLRVARGEASPPGFTPKGGTGRR